MLHSSDHQLSMLRGVLKCGNWFYIIKTALEFKLRLSFLLYCGKFAILVKDWNKSGTTFSAATVYILVAFDWIISLGG